MTALLDSLLCVARSLRRNPCFTELAVLTLGLAAEYIPAQRAARVQPMLAVRTDSSGFPLTTPFQGTPS